MKLAFIYCLLFLLVSEFALAIENDKLEDQINTISHKLRCPICQGLSVKESMDDISMNMKTKIRSLLEEGKNEEQVLKFFETRYGEWILRNPKKDGLNISLWLFPLGGIILAACLITYNLIKKSIKT